MVNEKNILQLMCYSRNTYYVWKREKRPIIELIDKYFTNYEVEEFLKNGKIEKQERFKELLEIEKKYNQITKIIDGSKML